MIIKLKIDCTKIDKNRLFVGKNGAKYLDATIFVDENKPADQYGNNGMITQDVTKEEREQKIRGAILGNFKIINQHKGGTSLKHTNPNDKLDATEYEDGQIPF